eukprot:360851-Chlamydomonas_euryale.AAC.6
MHIGGDPIVRWRPNWPPAARQFQQRLPAWPTRHSQTDQSREGYLTQVGARVRDIHTLPGWTTRTEAPRGITTIGSACSLAAQPQPASSQCRKLLYMQML